MTPATLGATLLAARGQLRQTLSLDADVAALEAYVLLGHVLNKSRAYLLAHTEAALADGALAQFAALLTRRLQGEPIAYLVGRREFYGLEFRVTPDVLIPRPETELLVECALAHLPDDKPMRVLDLGTGSGAIAITLAKHRPRAQITALDVSPRALAIARENAMHLGAANVSFVVSDWFAALPPAQSFDVIVANPPYVAENDPHLAEGDVRFEPMNALASGPDGLAAIRQITQTALRYLSASGRLLFEHGFDQGFSCRRLLQDSGYTEIATHIDLAGHERLTQGSHPAINSI